jgi:uncharacterized protein (TIGR00251 family)
MNIREKDGAIIFAVRVIPRSSRSEITGEHDGALKVKLAAPPVDGAANEELIALLAKEFGVSKSAVTIVGGQTSKTKTVSVANSTKENLTAILQAKFQRDIFL